MKELKARLSTRIPSVLASLKQSTSLFLWWLLATSVARMGWNRRGKSRCSRQSSFTLVSAARRLAALWYRVRNSYASSSPESLVLSPSFAFFVLVSWLTRARKIWFCEKEYLRQREQERWRWLMRVARQLLQGFFGEGRRCLGLRGERLERRRYIPIYFEFINSLYNLPYNAINHFLPPLHLYILALPTEQFNNIYMSFMLVTPSSKRTTADDRMHPFYHPPVKYTLFQIKLCDHLLSFFGFAF